ncbi:hypothetical protein PG990_007669 [Apiospora arundinis]
MSSLLTSLSDGEDEPVMPIAIIGIGGRFPGDASNPEKLWEMISKGQSALSKVPPDRFNIDAFYHPYGERQGTINAREAHFMNRDVSAFDAPFFKLSATEAKAMDPQQRWCLESTYEALENAGLTMDQVNGSNTSVYVGSFTTDYSNLLNCDREDLPTYQATGTGAAMMANRISWYFNFKADSTSFDTACSSSLVALHHGCKGLRTGECTMSVVGGVNFILLPDMMSTMSHMNFLSPDGTSKPFDHRANGYSRGEGAAFCVLKPLDLALKDGDVIRAVIRNTDVNQDGFTPGITQPSSEAQENLIRRVYADAGLNLAHTTYVEAHGTGTPIGDPLEAKALGRTFGNARQSGDSVYIGSLKSNIGHLEGGSGTAQVIKAIFMLEQGQIPPSLYYEKPNPHIPMDDWNLRVPTELTPWPADGLRRISINSFGYGGTNAHCILDDAYHYLKERRIAGNHNVKVADGSSPAISEDSGVSLSEPIGPLTLRNTDTESETEPDKAMALFPRLLIWSSNEKEGVYRTCAAHASYLKSKFAELEAKHKSEVFSKLIRTLHARRSRLPWKSFSIVNSLNVVGTLEGSIVEPVRSSGEKLPLIFIFTGQGAQWYAMVRQLFSVPVFRKRMNEADAYMKSLGASWSLTAELYRDQDDTRLGLAHISQPACIALQVALVDLLRQWKVVPDSVIGHSSGEIAAAYAKGAITRQDAWAIAFHRGRLASQVGRAGAMVATDLGPDEAKEFINRHVPGRVAVACFNSPSSTTLSGDAEAIDELLVFLKEDNRFVRKLEVDVPYHSNHMKDIAEEYHQSLADIKPLPEDSKGPNMFSSLEPGLVTSDKFQPEYWVANMVSPVNFLGGLEALILNGPAGKPRRRANQRNQADPVFIEIGPHGALKGYLRQILTPSSEQSGPIKDLRYQSVLWRGSCAAQTSLGVAGKLFQLGYPIDIEAVNCASGSQSGLPFLVDLPPFNWNHNLKYWSESHAARAHRFREHPRIDLLGSQTIDSSNYEPRYRNILRCNEVPWMKHHKVQEHILYPAAGMMAMSIEAMRQRADQSQEVEGYELRDVVFAKAIIVPEGGDGVETMLTLRPSSSHGSGTDVAVWQEFQLYSRRESWERNCSGMVRICYKSNRNAAFANEEEILASEYRKQNDRIIKESSRRQSPLQFYDNLASAGLHYGSVFQGLVNINKGDYQAACTIRIHDTKETMPHQFEYPHVIHPTTLDSIIQMAAPSGSTINEDITSTMVPTGIRRLYISAKMPTEPGTEMPGFSCSEEVESGGREVKVVLAQDEQWNNPLVRLEGLTSAAVGSPTDFQIVKKLNSVPCWQPDVSLLDSCQVRKIASEWVVQGTRSGKIIFKEIEMAILIIINRIMVEIPPQKAASLVGHFKLFWEWMKQCHEKGARGELCYQTPESDWLNMSAEDEAELLLRVSRSSADGAAVVGVGKHMARILRGEVPPHEILMADDLLANTYHRGLESEEKGYMLNYVALMAHKNPGMQILEIGAGTASTALPILQALGGSEGTPPRFKSYTFTDISPGYCEKARETLAPWVPYMEFRSLDISEDPVSQHFEQGLYDLIIAENVIHATKSVKQAMAHIRKLLKPGGKLLLTELTNPDQKMRTHFVVGAFEGWWYGEEDGRHGGPLLSVNKWDEVMKSTGFSGVDIDFGIYQDGRHHSTSYMVTTASEPSKGTSNEPSRDPVAIEALVVLPNHDDLEVLAFVGKLGKMLAEQGVGILVRKLGEIADVELEQRSVLVFFEAAKQDGCLPNISCQDWNALHRIIMTSRNTVYATRGGMIESKNPSASLMSGMARSIRAENYEIRLTMLDLEYDSPLDLDETISATKKLFLNTCSPRKEGLEDSEFAVRDGLLMVQRIVLDKGLNTLMTDLNVRPASCLMPLRQEGRPLTMAVATPGRLDTLYFRDDPNTAALHPLHDSEVEIEIEAVSLNFKDIMVAMGQLQQPALGLDCSGIVRRVGNAVTKVKMGDAVMTWKLGTMGSRVRAEESMVQLVPGGMDLVTAASIPLVYSTAHHSLANIARLKRGETLLVHGAAGGLGQAAIILAHHVGARVLATVSSKEKKQLLVKTYNIPEDHIFDSRDTKFASGIMRLTNNTGVDVVLNSLAGESLRLSWDCIARFGRFVELGQKDIVNNTGLEMAPFIRNVSFHSVNMLDLLEYDVPTASRVFSEVVGLLHKGVVRPVNPITHYRMSEAEEAFRTMQMGKHMGKIVLKIHDGDEVMVTPPPHQAPVCLRPDATYIIGGGSGGLGRSIAEWMARVGAKNILLLTRSGERKQNVRDVLDRLRKNGVRAAAFECDVGNESQLQACLARCKSEDWPEIRGVIQGAMKLQDRTYRVMTQEDFIVAIGPKVQGTWNLHKHLPKTMDFFVSLSSTAGIVGTLAQGNYGAGNAYQDALAYYRRGQGLPACTIDIGKMMGVGFLSEETTDDRVHENMRSTRICSLQEHELLALIQAAIVGQSVSGAATPTQIITCLPTGGMMEQAKQEYPAWFSREAKFDHISRIDTHHVAQGLRKGGSGQMIRDMLSQATNLDAAVEVVIEALIEKLVRLLMIPPQDIDITRPVTSFGLDSLVATELRSWILAEIQSEISILDLNENVPMSSLAKKIVLRSKAVSEEAKTD